MSPEQARGESVTLTAASDVFSLGATLYRLLAGVPPFTGSSSYEIIKRIQDTEPIRPSVFYPRISRDLENVCLKCIRKPPGARYRSALELAEDLERWLRHEPVLARRPGPIERFGSFCRRRPSVALLGGLSLSLLTAFVIHLGVSRTQLQGALTESQTQTRLAEDEADNARRERSAAELARSELEETVLRMRLRNVDQEMREGRTTEAIADLAQLARNHPSNLSLQHRVLGELVVRPWGQLAGFRMEHPAPVTRILYSPDGKRIYTGAEDGAVRVFDAYTSESIGDAIQVAEEAITTLDLDPAGEWLTACSRRSYAVFDVSQLEWREVSRGVKSDGGFASLSPDRRRFALLANRKLEIRSVPDEELVYRGKGMAYVSHGWSPDSASFVYSGAWGQIHRVSVADGSARKARLPAGRRGASSIMFNPSGDRFLTIDHGNAAILWNAKSMKELQLLYHAHHISAADYIGSEKLAATGDEKGVIRLWRGGNFNSQPTRIHCGDPVEFIRLSKDGGSLLAVVRGAAGLRAIVYTIRMASSSVEFPLWSDVFDCDPNFRSAAVVTDPTTVRMWSLASSSKVGRTGFKGLESARDVALSADENYAGVVTDNMVVEIRKMPSFKFARSEPKMFTQPPDMSFHPVAPLVALKGKSRVAIHRLDVQKNSRVIAAFPRDEGRINGVGFHTNNTELIVGLPSFVAVCGLIDGEEKRRLEISDSEWTGYSAAHNQILSLCGGDVLTRSDPDRTDSAPIRHQLPLQETKPGAVGVSRGGRWFWRISSDNVLQLADLTDRQTMVVVSDSRIAAKVIEFSEDETKALIISPQGSGVVYDLRSGAPAATARLLDDQLLQGQFVRDGEVVATMSGNQMVGFWSVDSGLPCWPPILLDRRPTSFAVSDKLERLVVCDATYTDRVVQTYRRLESGGVKGWWPDLLEALISARRLPDGRLVALTYRETNEIIAKIARENPEVLEGKRLHPWIRLRMEDLIKDNEP